MRIGKYFVLVKEHRKRFIIKNKEGEDIVCMQVKYLVCLKHEADDDEIVFSRYLHQRKWYWRDSRQDSNCSREHIVSEIARMLKIDAESFVTNHLKG